MSEANERITLKLEGSRARRGVSLSDFETFIDNFIAALRDFDRDRRGKETRKTGHPEARAEAVAAFRLVGFREGSAIATIEPELAGIDDAERLVDAEGLQVENLRALLGAIEHEEALPEPVSEALEGAVGSAGEEASLSVSFGEPAETETEPRNAVVIDIERLRRIRELHSRPPATRVSSISGRLHQVDFEPDKLAIRASNGVDWSCSFPAHLEQTVQALVNRIVWAAGDGELSSAKRGKMVLSEIRAVEQGVQVGLFSEQPLDEERLLAEQGIAGPQGLDSLSVESWDEEDDAYLAALESL